MMNLKLAAAMAALSLALVPAAFAQEQEEISGFYLGGGAGQFNASIDDVDDIDATVDNWDEDDTAYKFFAGYRLNSFLAFELDYINLGEPSGEVVPGRNVDSSVDGFAPYVVGTIPLGQYFELYGRSATTSTTPPGAWKTSSTTASSSTRSPRISCMARASAPTSARSSTFAPSTRSSTSGSR